MAGNTSVELLARIHAGDEQAPTELFRRYTDQLIAMAAAKLSAKLARRIDPEDVVQSAYRSFFAKARDGRYTVERSGDLWRLLVGITVHKLQHQAERHTAGKRAVGKERRACSREDSHDGLTNVPNQREPTPLDAAALADEVKSIMALLEVHHRPILELRLQGYDVEEIAGRQDCSERTVRRVLDRVKRYLMQARSSDEGQT